MRKIHSLFSTSVDVLTGWDLEHVTERMEIMSSVGRETRFRKLWIIIVILIVRL